MGLLDEGSYLRACPSGMEKRLEATSGITPEVAPLKHSFVLIPLGGRTGFQPATLSRAEIRSTRALCGFRLAARCSVPRRFDTPVEKTEAINGCALLWEALIAEDGHLRDHGFLGRQ